MKERLIRSWITTGLGVLIGAFGGLLMWHGKTTVWETIPIWIIAAVFIRAKDSVISGLIDRIPKLK